MILFCHCFHSTDDDFKLYLTIAGSLAIAIISHFLVRYWDSEKSRKEKLDKKESDKKKLCSEIYALCDKLHRLNVAYEYSTLTGRYYYTVSKLPEGESHDLPSTIYYRDKAEKIGSEISSALNDLVKNINELAIYWNNKETLDRMVTLLLEIHHSHLRQFDWIYKDFTDYKSLNAQYQKDLGAIEGYVAQHMGKHLMELQHLVGDNILVFNQEVKKKAEKEDKQEQA